MIDTIITCDRCGKKINYDTSYYGSKGLKLSLLIKKQSPYLIVNLVKKVLGKRNESHGFDNDKFTKHICNGCHHIINKAIADFYKAIYKDAP